LKTITLNSTTKLVRSKGLILLLSLFTCGGTFAQLQNNGKLYVRDNGILCLKAGNYGFGTGSATTQTTRTASTYGKVVFGSAATSSGAAATHFIDGYARILSDNSYVVSLGQTSVLAPIRIDAINTNGVDAAFYNAQPIDNLDIDADLIDISASEYWDISGTAATLSLSYRATTVANVTNTLYTIVGYNSGTTTWDVIPSTIDLAATSISGLNSTNVAGSLTSDADVDFSTYRFFTIGSKGDPCAPLIASSGIIKQWTGSAWVLNSDGSAVSDPTIADPVIIAGNYAVGSFSCNSMVINTDVTVTLLDGEFIDCVNEVGGLGTIILGSEANFVQRNNASLAPSIVLNKRTRTTMRRYDYIYWGTPIAGDFLNQFAQSQANLNALTSPTTLLGAFDNFYSYNSGGTVAGISGWQPLGSTVPGIGFIARVKQQEPFTNSTNIDFINMKFTGLANNGTITVPVTYNTLSPLGGQSHNLLANPYPSAISADKFLTANQDIDGVLYIWTAASSYSGSGSYSQADYISYTRLGSTAANGIDETFSGNIASGQGFKVRGLALTSTAVFNNCMRLTTDNTDFYKSSLHPVVDRYKINMTGAEGVFSQILVGYTPETTLGYDRMYDATRNSVSTAQVYTLLDNTTRRLAINARPSFVNTDKVALGLKKSNANAETFVFAITEKEGIFTTDNVIVYLHDKVLDTYHNFNNGSFSFTTTATNLSDRFDLVYQPNSELSDPEFASTQTYVLLNKNIFKVNSTSTISTIDIYDIAGRLIAAYSNIDNNVFTTDFNKVQGVYIAKIKLTDGIVVTQKVLNQ
jgi:hypothetical protein